MALEQIYKDQENIFADKTKTLEIYGVSNRWKNKKSIIFILYQMVIFFYFNDLSSIDLEVETNLTNRFNNRYIFNK